MVEFGLKLEDNKVSEWAHYYINYEKLKKLLEKLNKAVKRRDTLEKQNPEQAQKIRDEFVASTGSEFQSRPVSPVSDRSVGGFEDEDVGLGEMMVPTTIETSEMRALVKDKESSGQLSYGSAVASVDSKSSAKRKLKGSTSDLAKAYIESSKEMVSDMLGRKFEPKYKDSLKEVEHRLTNFSESLYEELDKVNTFYQDKEEEIEERLAGLRESVVSTVTPRPRTSRNFKPIMERRGSLKEFFLRQIQDIQKKTAGDIDEEELSDKDKREEESIRRALTDLYRTAKLLQNFAQLNYTGFVKIVKKFNKNNPEHSGRYKVIFDSKLVCEGKEIEITIDKMEKIYAKWFCSSNVLEARVQLLPKQGDGLQMDWSQLRLGYRLGMCSVLTLWVFWDCVWGLFSEGNSTIGGRTAFPVFRACGGLLLLHWFWGFSVFIWTRYRINYIYLFDFDPRIVDTPMIILKDVVNESLVFLVLMLLYYKSGVHAIPGEITPGIFPFLLVIYTIKRLIFPLKTRLPLWKAIYEVLTSPIISPKFFHTYVADVFTSMVKVFQDILWTVCFIAFGDFLIPEENINEYTHDWQHSFWYKNIVIPLICLFPLWIRFSQCLRRYIDTRKRCPNLANAFKYAMSQTVTLFGAFHPLYLLHEHHHSSNPGSVNLFQAFWLIIFVASSLYSYFWDVYMDWGLGRPQYKFLGPRLMFPYRYHYYGVMFADFFLRFMWVMTLIPPQSGASFELPHYMTAITMSLELLRRTLWGFFRLENEHRVNTAGFRRTHFVPLHFNTGHEHKYHQAEQNVGWKVLAEVVAVGVAVIAVSVSSVLAARASVESNDDE